MADYFDSLAQKFLSKSSLQECSIDEIKSIANQYPYFAPAQFLLLKKLDKNSEEYRQQYGKAILYYHDPLQFEQLFHPEKWNTTLDIGTSADEEDLYEETSIANEIIEKEEVKFEEEKSNEEVITTEEVNEKENLEEKIEETPIQENITEELKEEISIQENITEETNFHIAEEKSEVLQENKLEAATDLKEEELLNNIEEDTKDLPPLPKIEIKEIAPDENALTFEPYHTVDYFASQGIKLSADANATDKFGKQLKSFTEWLKTMKRLPANKVADNIDPTTEKKVENLASHSVEDPNIVTEAMAEVWLKQGNIEKAIEVYNKLSLSNPSKNAFFAAKIQNLKNRP